MTGEQLAELARRNGADHELVELLHGVGKVDGPNGVMKELKGHLGGQPRE
jgi:predicted HD phosphohydrolase